MPFAYGDTKEIIEIWKVIAKYDKIFVVHQISEADTILGSRKEIIRIGRECGVKINSHFKVCGKKNWERLIELWNFLIK